MVDKGMNFKGHIFLSEILTKSVRTGGKKCPYPFLSEILAKSVRTVSQKCPYPFLSEKNPKTSKRMGLISKNVKTHGSDLGILVTNFYQNQNTQKCNLAELLFVLNSKY